MQANHPSLHDDLWGQYWLAGVAAGLAYCHKAGQPEEQRLAGLIYAAANLKRYASVFQTCRSRPTSNCSTMKVRLFRFNEKTET